jgi:hypothetical protein
VSSRVTGLSLETDLVDRLRVQPVGRRTHEEAQVIDRGEVTQASAYCPQYVTQS